MFYGPAVCARRAGFCTRMGPGGHLVRNFCCLGPRGQFEKDPRGQLVFYRCIFVFLNLIANICSNPAIQRMMLPLVIGSNPICHYSGDMDSSSNRTRSLTFLFPSLFLWVLLGKVLALGLCHCLCCLLVYPDPWRPLFLSRCLRIVLFLPAIPVCLKI